MDWQKLDLTKASVLKREVDVALQRVYDTSTNPEINKGKLLSAIQNRIQELENFCVKNGDGTYIARLLLFLFKTFLILVFCVVNRRKDYSL
jgi:hypothetical protein